MNDTMGLIYDDDAAIHFAHKATGLPEEIVRRALRSKDRYLLGLGILPAEAALDGETPQAIRAAHPDLFRAENIRRRFIAIESEREYIRRDSGLDAASVEAIISADDEYMRRRGIID
jgi:hypothetical protein